MQEFGLFGLAQLVAKEYAVATRLRHVLDDEAVEHFQHIFHVLLVIRQVRGSVLQNRLFAQVVLHHLGHKVVNALVVRHAVARRVHNGHLALAVHVVQVRDANDTDFVERHRVQKVVADAPVNDAHRLLFAAVVRVHDLVVLDHQVAARHQVRTRQLRQIAVLKIRRVEASWRQNDAVPARVHVVHGAPQ